MLEHLSGTSYPRAFNSCSTSLAFLQVRKRCSIVSPGSLQSAQLLPMSIPLLRKFVFVGILSSLTFQLNILTIVGIIVFHIVACLPRRKVMSSSAFLRDATLNVPYEQKSSTPCYAFRWSHARLVALFSSFLEISLSVVTSHLSAINSGYCREPLAMVKSSPKFRNHTTSWSKT